MNEVTVKLPEGVAREIERLAREGGVTPEQFVASAASEKLSAIISAGQYFTKRGERPDWKAFDQVFGVDVRRGELPRSGDETG